MTISHAFQAVASFLNFGPTSFQNMKNELECGIGEFIRARSSKISWMKPRYATIDLVP